MANPNIVNVVTIGSGNALWHLQTDGDDKLTVEADKILKINSILASNVDGSASKSVSVAIIKTVNTTPTPNNLDVASGLERDYGESAPGAGTQTFYIVKAVKVPALDVLIILDTSIYLMETDVLQALCVETNDKIDLLVSYEVISV